MTDLVTTAEARAFCRVDGSDEDATLDLLIAAATEAVLEQADAWEGPDVPARLKLAVLTRVAETFDNRGNAPRAANEPDLTLPFSSFLGS